VPSTQKIPHGFTTYQMPDTPRVGTGAAWMLGGGARAVLVPKTTHGGMRTLYWRLRRPGSSWTFPMEYPIGGGILACPKDVLLFTRVYTGNYESICLLSVTTE